MAGLVAGALACPAAARAADAARVPGAGADQIQFAAREHDLGYRAYLDKQFDDAATHFENAFFAAPNPVELRSAIRARKDANELARAATLAAIGLRRFPEDPATAKLAADVIDQALPHVHEIKVVSTAEYSLAVDERSVASERVKEARIFVTPGPHELQVSWTDDRNARVPIDAKAGGSETLQLDPPAAPAPTPPPVPPTPVVVQPPPRALSPVAPETPPPPPPKPFGPAVFIAGAALTAVGVGATVWSGIDTINNPGADTVRAHCIPMRMGDCQQLYDTGTSAQTRTNILLGATGVLAAATLVVGLEFTQWTSPAAPSGETRSPAPPSPTGAGAPAVRVVPTLGIGNLGVRGTF